MARLNFFGTGRRSRWTVLPLCALVLLAACWIGQALAAAFVGQVVKARGDVRIAREGADISAGNGTALQLGDVIKTGPGARLRLRFTDGSILALGENTQMSIDIYAVDATNKSRTVVLTVLEGLVNAAAAKSGENQFDYQIKTANGYSAVRGTKWLVSSHAGTMGLFVLNGQVELGANAAATTGAAKPVLVNGGNWGSIDAQGAIAPPQPTTPDMLKALLDATADTGGGGTGVAPPQPAPTQIQPTVPLVPGEDDEPNRAFKSDRSNKDRNKMDKDHYGNSTN